MNERLLRHLGCAILLGACFVSQANAQDNTSTGGSSSDLNSLLGPASSQPAANAPSDQTAPKSDSAASTSAAATNTAAGDQTASSSTATPAADDTSAAIKDNSTSSSSDSSKTAKVAKAKAAAPATNRVKSRITEEIVVTSERRSQNLQDVPSSVSAFTGSTLDAKGITDTKDLQNITPGLEYGAMATYSIIFLRGVGSDSYQSGVNSTVATYLDGLYLPFTFSAAEALGDVERIEVLKGPQGALYGQNAVGGAIVIKLKKPTKTFTASVLGQYGNYNDKKGKVAVSGPVPYTDDKLLYSFSYLYEDHDAYTKSALALNTKPFRPSRNRGFRGVLEYDPFDGIELSGEFYYIKNQTADDVATNLYNVDPLLVGTLTPDQRPHYSGNSDNIGENGTTKIYLLKAKETTLPWFEATLTAGHIRSESTILFDYDSSPEPVLDISAVPNTSRSDSIELDLTSKADGTPSWLEYVAGASYANETRTGRYTVTVDGLATVIGLPGAGLAGGASPICQLYQNLGGDCTANTQTNKNPVIVAPLTSGLRNKSLAAYGQATFHFTDTLDLLLGGRATHEQEALLYSQVDAYAVLPGISGVTNTVTTPTLAPIQFAPREQDNNSFTPTVGLNYHFTPDILFYYKYSEGFLSSNYNGLNVVQAPTSVKPENGSANEIGFKSSLLEDRSLKLNGAIFNNDLTNAQLQTVTLTSGGVTSLQNAGSYTVYGAELEANWFVPYVDGLVLTLNGSFLHGRYGQFIGKGFDSTTGINIANNFVNSTGKKTVRTPTFSGTASVDYTFPFFFGLTAEAAGDYYYNSGYYYDTANTFKQPNYYTIGARFSLFDPRTNIRVTAYGKNLNDGVFFTNGYVEDFGNTVIYGAPRVFGVTVTWNYGS